MNVGYLIMEKCITSLFLELKTKVEDTLVEGKEVDRKWAKWLDKLGRSRRAEAEYDRAFMFYLYLCLNAMFCLIRFFPYNVLSNKKNNFILNDDIFHVQNTFYISKLSKFGHGSKNHAFS